MATDRSFEPGTGRGPDVPPTADELAARILSLPDVQHVQAGAENGAPEAAWGQRFFFVGAGRRRPFATLVAQDVAGFDVDSGLDRPGVFRLNVELGRRDFERRFGYPPAEFADHRSGIDFARLDEILPHPVYGTHGWACVLNPSPERLPEVDRLLAAAHARAARRPQRHGPG